jgi:hypothetical protein
LCEVSVIIFDNLSSRHGLRGKVKVPLSASVTKKHRPAISWHGHDKGFQEASNAWKVDGMSCHADAKAWKVDGEAVEGR